MKQIQLTQGKVALVDDADYEAINAFKWYASKSRKKGREYTYYAKRSILISSSKRRTVYMHRIILNAAKGIEIDHINGDGLDNRQSNLRLCTHTENIRNQRLNRQNTTGFKGVTIRKSSIEKPFYAKIKVNNKWISLGCHSTAEVAAQAYDRAALEHFGEFALTNNVIIEERRTP